MVLLWNLNSIAPRVIKFRCIVYEVFRLEITSYLVFECCLVSLIYFEGENFLTQILILGNFCFLFLLLNDGFVKYKFVSHTDFGLLFQFLGFSSDDKIDFGQEFRFEDFDFGLWVFAFDKLVRFCLFFRIFYFSIINIF